MQRNLGGKIPPERTVAVGHQFKATGHFHAAAQDMFILGPVHPGERVGEEIFRSAAKQLARVGKPEPLGERGVGSLVAALRVLEAKHDVRQLREEPLAKCRIGDLPEESVTLFRSHALHGWPLRADGSSTAR